MSPGKSPRSELNASSPSPTLADRVRARVVEAGQLLEEREQQAEARQTQRRPDRKPRPAGSLTNSSASQREARSLRYVYSEMRAIYRSHRRQTGTPAVPALRSAVNAFQRGPSLTSLVQVATFLDDRQLLRW